MKKRPEEGDIYRENNIFDTYGSKRLNWHELSNVIPSYLPQTNLHVHRCQNLIATVLHTSQHLSKITEPPAKVWKLISQFNLFDP